MPSLKRIKDRQLLNALIDYLCTTEGKATYKKYYDRELAYGIQLCQDDWGDVATPAEIRMDARSSAITYVCAELDIEVSDIDHDCFINTPRTLNAVISRSTNPAVILRHLTS